MLPVPAASCLGLWTWTEQGGSTRRARHMRLRPQSSREAGCDVVLAAALAPLGNGDGGDGHLQCQGERSEMASWR
jgi:hypothetical protein